MTSSPYGNGMAESVGPLERSRLEKAAQDAGFDLSAWSEGNWLIFRSTAFPQMLGLSAQPDEGYRVGLSDATIGRQLASEFGMDAVETAEYWATRLDRVPDYQTLHRLLERVAAMWRVVAGSGLRNFENRSRKLQNTTEAIRLAVQRVGQDIFRASLLEYWGGALRGKRARCIRTVARLPHQALVRLCIRC